MIKSNLIPYIFFIVQLIFMTGCSSLPQGETVVSTPNPEVTSTPTSFQNAVSDIAKSTGIDRQVFLGLTGEDWINLGISLLIILVGTILLTRIVHILLRWITRFIKLRGPGGGDFSL